MPNKNVHTVHSERGWTNRYENSNRTLGYYNTKAEAQALGREIAIQNILFMDLMVEFKTRIHMVTTLVHQGIKNRSKAFQALL